MNYRLTIFEADDLTEWLSVSTDLEDTNPWMMVPDQWAETEVNFASGSASIGEIVIEVLDPQTGGTQAQRGFTAKLADSSGRSALSGRRALVEDSEDGYAFRTIFDGVINRVELSDSLSSFFISIRDIRERERDVELFRFTETCSVLPAGVLNGYGIPYAGAPTTEWLVPPTAPVTGVFRLNPSQLFGEGFVDLSEYVIGNTSDGVPIVRSEVVMSDAAIAASASTGENPRIRVLWRAEGSTGSYTTVNVGSFVQAAGTFVETIGAWVGSEDGRPVNAASRVAMPNGFGLANTLPANGDRVEIIVQYIGETSEDWPLHIEEVTAGELIRDIYDGDYSEEDPRVRFDETSILALNTPVRARITEPVTDAREWVERNLYVAAGAAPAIIDGVVHAVTYELPDVSVEVTELGNAEADVMPGWAQSTDDAVNVVEVVYPRDRSVAPDEPGYDSVPGDRVVSREIIEKRIVPESISLLGEKRQTFRVDVLRAIGGPLGEPYSGDVADETGAQVAKRIGAMMTDRFALGGQTFVVMADRTLPDVEELNVGDWVVVTTTWTPDYQTNERGGNRLGQIVARRDQSPIRCELVIQDAGPDAQPLVMPTLGTLTQTGLGEVQVPIATVPSGAVARVDYAISTTQPAIGSPLWTFAGRGAATETVTTPQLPSGKKVWIRARSEGVGRRPSGYTTPVQIDIDQRVQLRKIFAYDAPDGIEINWVGNTLVAGVRVEYVAHPFGEQPDYAEGDTQDSATSPVIITDEFDRFPGEVLSFRVTPFPTFSGGSVSGTPGQPLEDSIFIGEPLDVPFGNLVAFRTDLELEFQAQGNPISRGGRWVVRLDDPPEAPDDPLAEATGSFEGPFDLEELTLSQAPDYGEVWVAVFFFDDYDQSLDEPTGKRGPRVLARAREQPEVEAVPQDVQIQSVLWQPDTGESGGTPIEDAGGGANRVAVWTAKFSDKVRSYKIVVGPFSAPSGSPVEANYYETFTGPGLVSDFIRNLNTGGELTTQNALQFPGSYDVDSTVQVIAFASADATGTALGDDSVLLRREDPLNLNYYVSSGTVIEGQALRAGTGIDIALVDSMPEISIDATSLSIQLGDIQDAGSGTGTGRLVVGTATGADTIPSPSATGQVLKAKTTGTTAEYEWGEVTSGVTSVGAGDGLSGGGTGAVTLNVNAYGGFDANRGQTAIQSDAVAVVLGTTGNTAAAGNHDHDASAIVSGTFNAARIPNLDASKTTTGTFNEARIPSINLATKVSGVLPVSSGGTNATNATDARTNLGAGTVSSVSGGNGLTGTVTTTGSLALGTPSNVGATSSNSTTSTSHTHALDGAIADVTVSGSAPSGTPARAGSLHFVV